MTLPWLNDLAMLARLTRDFPGFIRTPITSEQAVEVIQGRLAAREERFLRMAERAIYGHQRSPYHQLLRAAGCEFGDLKALVDKEGLERALSRLVEAGVFVTFDEFKGRKEAVRGSRRFVFAEDDFDNPHLSPHFEARSGGTRGPSTSVKRGLPSIADLAVTTALALDAHGLSQSEHALWLVSGMTPMLIYAKVGRAPIAWFFPSRPIPAKLHAGSLYLAALGRLLGRRLPTPEFLDLQDPGRMALWLGASRKRRTPLCVTTYASSAVRICAAAKERGISLDGVWFITLGEPYTEAKQRIVETVGARALVRYAFTEAGIIGYGCADPRLSDDLHFFDDCYGLIQHSREVGDSGLSVDAFLFTSLLPSAPKILLNVESGDYGTVWRRDCGCQLGAVGLTTHLAKIRSFEKLTGEGMTFVQTDLLRLLEEVLPSHYGGTSTDYQLLEEEGEDGILRLLLLVSPRIGPVDEERIRGIFVDELGGDGGFARAYADVWRRAGTVQVKRQWPVPTKAGKILPFHVIKR
jgi:hypothetical protein